MKECRHSLELNPPKLNSQHLHLMDPLSNATKPSTDATITVRVIKSFKYRNVKNLLLSHLDLTTTTVAELLKICKQEIGTRSGWMPYRNVDYDTFKFYTKAHGSKTTNLVINLDNEEWILNDPSKFLVQCGLEHECEVSLFNRADYDTFILDPQQSW